MKAKHYATKMQKTAEIYLYVTIFCALFGAVYEYFSFGVYSYFMIYAFLWPLILGVLPFMIMGRKFDDQYIKSEEKNASKAERQLGKGESDTGWCGPDLRFWHAGVATLTVGSVFKGIVSIYGTTSPFTVGYAVAGVLLLVRSVCQKGRFFLTRF